jgi:hypothetical protein
MHRLGTLITQIGRLFGPKHQGADQSRLMAMYLDQTNRPISAGTRGGASQQRQDGKFSQNRGRAVKRSP